MSELVEYLGYVNLGLYTAVAVIALAQWHRGRGRAGLWAALTFGALALVIDVGQALPEDGTVDEVGTRFIVAVLVLFPYLLYRFTTAFRPPTRRLEQLVGLMTLTVLVWTFALPSFPDEGEPRPLWFNVYVAGFTLHWTILTIVVAWRLWRAGRGQPTVARRRMFMLGFGAAAITGALLIAVVGGEESSLADLMSQLLSTLSALSFLLGLSPPTALRAMWRRPEQDRVQHAISELMSATSEAEVMERVLPPMTRLLGANGVTFFAPDGRLVGAYGKGEGGEAQLVHVDLPSGARLDVWTTPYAPYFGDEELKLLHTLGSLTELALDRTRLFSQEREARRILERADELKSNFIALAAHELRTPVTVIHGLVDTLERLGGQLGEQRRAELRAALRGQSDRLRLLVEQLLDLSRLDADAIAIMPEAVRVRERVEALVEAAAAERRGDVQVEIAPELETRVDPEVLDRVVSNLVVNALRYGEPPVTVSAERSDRHFRLTVEDRGPGVSPEFIPELFERFARGGRAERMTEGTGLGLAIARSYARAHRGDLLYEPAEPQGARFQLVLPSNGNNAGGT